MKPFRFEDNAYVVLDGDLNLLRKNEISEALPAAAAIKTGAISLAGATFVDSFVMGLLVQFRRQFLEHGGEQENLILILSPNGAVRRALEIAGLTRLFPIAYLEPASPSVEGRITRPASDTRT